MIFPIWERNRQEVILKSFTNINVESTINKIAIEPVQIGSKEFFEANAMLDYELFSYYLCNRKKTNFSFCSNIVDFNLVKESDFSIITTSKNIITRLKRYNIEKTDSKPREQFVQENSVMKDTEISQESEIKKKGFIVLLTGLILFVLIIVILLLI